MQQRFHDEGLMLEPGGEWLEQITDVDLGLIAIEHPPWPDDGIPVLEAPDSGADDDLSDNPTQRKDPRV
jgi:hypothetical protein